jgi:hypothetical protein
VPADVIGNAKVVPIANATVDNGQTLFVSLRGRAI